MQCHSLTAFSCQQTRRWYFASNLDKNVQFIDGKQLFFFLLTQFQASGVEGINSWRSPHLSKRKKPSLYSKCTQKQSVGLFLKHIPVLYCFISENKWWLSCLHGDLYYTHSHMCMWFVFVWCQSHKYKNLLLATLFVVCCSSYCTVLKYLTGYPPTSVLMLLIMCSGDLHLITFEYNVNHGCF